MITPPYLRKNDTVGLIAPAKNFDAEGLQPALSILKNWGLQVKIGESVYNQYGPFAGTDGERASDLQIMVDDAEIKAIFCIRGGYGCNRIIDSIDWTRFLKSPKWIVGYSDITLLHCTLQRMGIESIHGIMPLQFSQEGSSLAVENLRKTLFGVPWSYETVTHLLNRPGRIEGDLVGGNLAILCSAIGTPSDFDSNNRILFIEDIGEYLYRLDRMMVQLKRAGKLSKLKGLVVGHLSDMLDNAVPFGKNANEIIFDAIKDYNYPVCFNFPIGHEPLNLPMVVGRKTILEIDNSVVKLSFETYSL